MVASWAENSDIIWLSDNGNRRTMLYVILTQFRRIIVVITDRDVAEIKIRRAEFIGSIFIEADAITKPEEIRSSRNSHSWYENKQNSDQYQDFYVHNSFYIE